ncbi:hypothetical protein R3P38DRAFT_2743351, partial [Favolaschia claudopus]
MSSVYESLLISALLDPMGPNSACAEALSNSVPHMLLEVLSRKAQYQVQLLDATMKFLTTPRSEDDHRRLREHLSECHCSPRNKAIPGLHNRSSPPTRDQALTFLDIIMQMLCCHTILPTVRRTTVTLPPSNAKKGWPRDERDLNPFGLSPTALCDTLLQWTSNPQHGSSVFCVIGALSLAFPEFNVHVFATPRVFHLATSHLEYALTHPAPKQISLQYLHFISQITACVDGLFVTVSHSTPDLIHHLLTSPHLGIVTRMLAIARGMQSILPTTRANLQQRSDMARTVLWFQTVCETFGESFVLTGAPEPSIPLSVLGELAMFELAWKSMVLTRSLRCAVGRTNSDCEPPTPRASHLCKGCGVVRYCGRPHQRLAWKSAVSPHRALCQIVQALRSGIHMEDDDRWKELLDTNNVGEFLRLCGLHKPPASLAKAIVSVSERPI